MTKITKLLIANRGEIALRVMRSARALDIATVAVFSEPDAGAPFVAAADEAVPLRGVSSAETYLDSVQIIEAAHRCGVDAIHPGYGFLSENADFARECDAAGLNFVGPPPSVIEAMGSKLAAKELMAAAGVPVLPGIVVDVDADVDPGALHGRVGREIGYPVLVKAAYGGGGRGMRAVHDGAALVEAVESARREAGAAFGDATVFLERLVDSPRHIEVQIFGDSYGEVVHLFERECSIQRRYQKIIEEAPSPAVDEDLRAKLVRAAIAAGRAIGYVGAGTVEFVLGADGDFYFLEVNARLQVEHPVTEEVTGLDLVALQIAVAEGRPLPEEARTASLRGHAIEARLYAEDVGAGFLPAAGTVLDFSVPELPGIRVDSGVTAGSEISIYYDPMVAKVIAHGATRDEACRRLARALAETHLHGVVSNRELLVGILREPEFRAGTFDTGYLERHGPTGLALSGRGASAVALSALAAALADQAERRASATVLTTVPTGWRNVPNGPQRSTFDSDEGEVVVDYRIGGWGATKDSVEASVHDQPLEQVRLYAADTDRVVLQAAGVRRTFTVQRVESTHYVDSALGSITLVEIPRFADPEALTVPGTLFAPMPGTVVRIVAAVGDEVRAGIPIVILEAMKMEHTIVAPHDGTVVEIGVRSGQAVDIGTVLAVVAKGEP